MRLRLKEVLVPVECFSNSAGAVCRTEKKLQYFEPYDDSLAARLHEWITGVPISGIWIDVSTVPGDEPDRVGV